MSWYFGHMRRSHWPPRQFLQRFLSVYKVSFKILLTFREREISLDKNLITVTPRYGFECISSICLGLTRNFSQRKLVSSSDNITVLRTYKGRTYKGQFTFFKKIYCARIRDKFLQKIIFNQKIWSNFFFLGELKFSIAQKIAESASCVKCQLGEVPVWKCVSWGERVEKFNPWTDDISPILQAVKIQLLFSALND